MSALFNQLQLLAGQKSDLEDVFHRSVDINRFENGLIGVSQMNELLLTVGFDRINDDFFMFLCKGKPIKYEDGTTIQGIEDLTKKVEAFRKYGALKYGNFKFAFKRWSQMSWEQIQDDIVELLPPRQNYFTTRTEPLENITEIPLKDRFLLGYISGSQGDSELLNRRNTAEEIGKENLRKYLTFDHMDVYVATSMRKYRDYISVGKFVKQVFNHHSIKPLKIRHFDPTQVYSPDRLCKGLVESLMLKRAKCCIYCVQETDTLGKDSELAITLAQGKPVLAYVPEVNDLGKYEQEIMSDSRDEDPNHVIDILRQYYVSVFPNEAFRNLDLFKSESVESLAREIARLSQQRFEERANTLLKSHPLAMQVDLDTGVAHGVIVVRNSEQCAKLLFKVLHRELEFNFEEANPSDLECAKGDYTKTYVLKEAETNSPYRVVIGDALLTNSFWNFYLKKKDT